MNLGKEEQMIARWRTAKTMAGLFGLALILVTDLVHGKEGIVIYVDSPYAREHVAQGIEFQTLKRFDLVTHVTPEDTGRMVVIPNNTIVMIRDYLDIGGTIRSPEEIQRLREAAGEFREMAKRFPNVSRQLIGESDRIGGVLKMIDQGMILVDGQWRTLAEQEAKEAKENKMSFSIQNESGETSTYRNVKILEILGDNVRISHSDGYSTVPKAKIPSSILGVTTTARTVEPPAAMEGPVPGETRRFGGIDMVWCPPGEAAMGSTVLEDSGRFDDEEPYTVTIRQGFWLAKTETTQDQWSLVMDENPSRFEGGFRPVEQVSWNEAVEWTERMNKSHPPGTGWAWSLPTEAQWEYAAKAEGKGGPVRSDSKEWHEETSSGQTRLVVEGLPNPWSLVDMLGNVAEWSADVYRKSPGAGGGSQGGGDGTPRVVRGGSWSSRLANCRSTYRDWARPTVKSAEIGFRAAIVPRE